MELPSELLAETEPNSRLNNVTPLSLELDSFFLNNSSSLVGGAVDPKYFGFS
jgi:hypothetical protein